MQIILLEKVGNLGQLGDVVKVRDGYARNFLIPQGKAKRVTPTSLAEFETRRAELEAKQSELLADAQARHGKLDGTEVSIEQKAGVDGRLFGSVTNADIAAAIIAAGVEVKRSDVRMPNGPLKAVGEYELEVALTRRCRSSQSSGGGCSAVIASLCWIEFKKPTTWCCRFFLLC